MAITTETPQPPAIHGHEALHRTALALRGVVAIALGERARSTSACTRRCWSAAFAAFAIVDGIVRIVIALRSTGRDRAWLIHALEGVVGIGLGVVAWTFAHSLISLTWTIADWAFGIGVLTIVFAALTWGRLQGRLAVAARGPAADRARRARCCGSRSAGSSRRGSRWGCSGSSTARYRC